MGIGDRERRIEGWKAGRGGGIREKREENKRKGEEGRWETGERGGEKWGQVKAGIGEGMLGG